MVVSCNFEAYRFTMATHNALGQKAEQYAATYLEEKGYTLLARNYRFGRAEIDLLAQLEDMLVVVEVKARSTAIFGSPESFVSRKKMKLLIEATHHYLEENNLNLEVRFDVIAYVVQGNSWQRQHIEGAFGAWEV